MNQVKEDTKYAKINAEYMVEFQVYFCRGCCTQSYKESNND